MAGASVASSITNLTKTIVGAGLLAIPYAFRFDGILFGSALILFGGLSTAYGLYIIGKVCHKVDGEASFFALCSISYPKLSLLFDLSIFIQCFGVSIGFLMLVGDLVPSLIDDYLSRDQVILSSLFIVVPLLCLKKLDSLKIGSIVGLVAIAYLIVLVFAHSVLDDYSLLNRGIVELWPKFSNYGGMLSTFSIIILAFTASHNMCSIINEIDDKTNVNFVIISTILIAGLIFGGSGLAGYLEFGNKIGGNVMLQYDSSLLSTKIGKFALALMSALSYPLLFHPCRISTNNMIHWCELELFTKYEKIEDINETVPLVSTFSNLENQEGAIHADIPFSDKRFIWITVILTTVTYGLAIFITSFEFILSLVGATGSTLISFVLPGLFGWRLIDDKLNKYLSLGLFVWGVFVMFASVYATLYL